MVFDIPAVAAPWKGAQGRKRLSAEGLRAERGSRLKETQGWNILYSTSV
jgi:hypothetical protein